MYGQENNIVIRPITTKTIINDYMDKETAHFFQLGQTPIDNIHTIHRANGTVVYLDQSEFDELSTDSRLQQSLVAHRLQQSKTFIMLQLSEALDQPNTCGPRQSVSVAEIHKMQQPIYLQDKANQIL